MVKEKKLNPADAERKKEAERRRKANAEARKAHREQALKKASVEDIQEQIAKLKRLGQTDEQRSARPMQRAEQAGGQRQRVRQC